MATFSQHSTFNSQHSVSAALAETIMF